MIKLKTKKSTQSRVHPIILFKYNLEQEKCNFQNRITVLTLLLGPAWPKEQGEECN